MLKILHKTDQFNRVTLGYLFTETWMPEDYMGLPSEITKLREEALEVEYRHQWLVRLTSFLNLPNQRRKTQQVTATDIFKNMLDINIANERKGNSISALDIVFAPFMFTFHVLRMLIKLPINIAKIFTEFLPGMGEAACRIAAEQAPTDSYKQYAFRAGQGIFSFIHFIGRALTSPVKGYNSGENGLGALSLLVSCLGLGALSTLVFAPAMLAAEFIANTLGEALTMLCYIWGYKYVSEQSVYSKHGDNPGIIKPFFRLIGSIFSPNQEHTLTNNENDNIPNTNNQVNQMLNNQQQQQQSNYYQPPQQQPIVYPYVPPPQQYGYYPQQPGFYQPYPPYYQQGYYGPQFNQQPPQGQQQFQQPVPPQQQGNNLQPNQNRSNN